MPTADLDADLLPEHARRIGSPEFTAEATRLLRDDFAKVGGEAQIEVSAGNIRVDWTPPPVGDSRQVSAIIEALFLQQLRAGPMLLRLWLRSNPDDLEKLARTATVWFSSIPQFASMSEVILRSAVAVAPENATAQKGLGLACLESGQPEPAYEHLRIATNRNAEDLESWLRLGDASVALGRTAEAERAYGRVIELRWPSWEASEARYKQLTNRAVEVFQGRVCSWSPDWQFEEVTT